MNTPGGGGVLTPCMAEPKPKGHWPHGHREGGALLPLERLPVADRFSFPCQRWPTYISPSYRPQPEATSYLQMLSSPAYRKFHPKPPCHKLQFFPVRYVSQIPPKASPSRCTNALFVLALYWRTSYLTHPFSSSPTFLSRFLRSAQ